MCCLTHEETTRVCGLAVVSPVAPRRSHPGTCLLVRVWFPLRSPTCFSLSGCSVLLRVRLSPATAHGGPAPACTPPPALSPVPAPTGLSAGGPGPRLCHNGRLPLSCLLISFCPQFPCFPRCLPWDSLLFPPSFRLRPQFLRSLPQFCLLSLCVD